MSELVEDLKQLIKNGQIIVVVGAGVSIASVGEEQRDVASWKGLLRNGVSRCASYARMDEKWAERVRGEIESSDLDDLLSAAEKIRSKLGAPNGGEFRAWLRETVGSLKAKNRETLDALHALNAPLATTNYDWLLEEVTNLKPITWENDSKVQRFLRDEERAVLHLHGHWDESKSVILGIRDYEKILGDQHAQTMQQVMSAIKSFLFVGCGAGLEDPNIGVLLDWVKKIFSGSEYRHYLLCLEKDKENLDKKYPVETRITPLTYGSKREELVGFLGKLASDEAPNPR
jgi:hypothetical protein